MSIELSVYHKFYTNLKYEVQGGVRIPPRHRVSICLGGILSCMRGCVVARDRAHSLPDFEARFFHR